MKTADKMKPGEWGDTNKQNKITCIFLMEN